jgi:hypothetical protein
MTRDWLTRHLGAGGLSGLQMESQRLVVDDQAYVSEVLVVQRYRCRPASPVQHCWEGFAAQHANCLAQLQIRDLRMALCWMLVRWVLLIAAALLRKPALRCWDQVMLQPYATSDSRAQSQVHLNREHPYPRAAMNRWAYERG